MLGIAGAILAFGERTTVSTHQAPNGPRSGQACPAGAPRRTAVVVPETSGIGPNRPERAVGVAAIRKVGSHRPPCLIAYCPTTPARRSIVQVSSPALAKTRPSMLKVLASQVSPTQPEPMAWKVKVNERSPSPKQQLTPGISVNPNGTRPMRKQPAPRSPTQALLSGHRPPSTAPSQRRLPTLMVPGQPANLRRRRRQPQEPQGPPARPRKPVTDDGLAVRLFPAHLACRINVATPPPWPALA